MRISVVIPSYNQAEYLPDAIDSVLSQYPAYDSEGWLVDVDITVVDDGSTDNSLEIARKYPIKIISQVNKGLSSARNTGIMNSHGEYIIFLDSDDIMLEGYIEKIVKVAEETNADIIAPSFQEFGLRQTQIVLMENPTLEDFKTGNRIGYCQAIKRSALQEVGGYSPRMTWGYEDMHLTINLLLRGKKLITIQEIFWLYRVKPNSMINTAQAHHEELMNQIKKDFPAFWA